MPSGSRQRHAQLVADHAEKLGALALQLLERREVLHGDHHRGDGAVLGVDRGGVDQRGHAAPVGDRERDLLGAHRLAAAQRARERELVEGDLAPVGAPVGDDLEQLLRRLAGSAQALDDPPGPRGCGAPGSGASLGWHFYCDRDDREAEERPVQPAPQSSPSSARERILEMRRQLEEARAYAILDPSPDKVTAYLRLQQETLQRAAAFSDAFRRTVWATPELELHAQAPGRRARQARLWFGRAPGRRWPGRWQGSATATG